MVPTISSNRRLSPISPTHGATSKRDARDGNVGIAGYEISFYCNFPPRPVEDIETEIVRVFTEATACASFR